MLAVSTFASHDGRLESGGVVAFSLVGQPRHHQLLPWRDGLTGDPRTTSNTELIQPEFTLLPVLNLNGGSRDMDVSFE